MTANPKSASLYFVLAPSYHGALTLSARANLHPDVLSLGTSNPLKADEQRCSCGEDVHKFCPFWTGAAKVIEKAEDDPLSNLLPQSPYIFSNKTLNNWVTGALSLVANEISPKVWKLFYESAERFFAIYDRFHAFCQSWVPHKVFLDAERSPLKFMAMASMGFPVKGVVHLVRDPRGYAAAWKKYYPESTAEKLGMEWAATHTRIRRLHHVFPKISFLTVRYEDLLEQPVAWNEKIFKFMGLEVFSEAEMPLDARKNHMLGLQSIDHVPGMAPNADNWRESLSAEDQERVVKAAGPLFSELGYKI